MPAGYRCASHGWLKNVTFIGPLSSATVASTSGRMPRRRTGREAMLRTATTTVAVSPGTSCGDRARLAPVTGQVLEQVPDGVQPERAAACSALAPSTSSGARAAARGAGSAPGPRRARRRRAGVRLANAVAGTVG